MVLMCLSVCLSVCLSAHPPQEAWTFRSKTDSKADNRRQSPGQATKLWTCQGQSMKAENRRQSREQVTKPRAGKKIKDKRQNQKQATKPKTFDKAGSVLVKAPRHPLPPPSLRFVPLRECAKLAWLMKLYTTILYSTGVKVVVDTTVGQLGAV